MRLRFLTMVVLVVVALASSAVMFIQRAGQEAAVPGVRKKRYIHVRVLDVRRSASLPADFLEDEASSQHFLLEVWVKLSNLSPSAHPADLAVERINKGPSRAELLRAGRPTAGQLWSYAVTSPDGRVLPGWVLPPSGQAWARLSFVVPMDVRVGTLDHRGRGLAHLRL